MRRTLRLFLCQCLVAGLAFPLTAAARDRWFNVDAGFERDPAKTPAASRSAPFRSA